METINFNNYIEDIVILTRKVAAINAVLDATDNDNHDVNLEVSKIELNLTDWSRTSCKFVHRSCLMRVSTDDEAKAWFKRANAYCDKLAKSLGMTPTTAAK